jgi:hypothetical protein
LSLHLFFGTNLSLHFNISNLTVFTIYEIMYSIFYVLKKLTGELFGLLIFVQIGFLSLLRYAYDDNIKNRENILAHV